MSYRRCLALGLIGILLAAVVFSPASDDTRWLRTLHDAAHGPIFGCLALLLLFIARHAAPTSSDSLPRQYALAFATASALGVATEAVQAVTDRDPSLVDAGRDVLGAAAFLLLFAALDRRIQPVRWAPGRIGAGVVGLALLAMLAAPVVLALQEYRLRDRRFPVLADFSVQAHRYFLGENGARTQWGAMPARWARHEGEAALHVRFSRRPYPGIEIIEPVPQWRGYATLALDLTNPTEAPLLLGLVIQDAQHTYEHKDDFSRRLRLAPNTRGIFRIAMKEIEAGPQHRRLDLDRIAAVVLFRSASPPQEMYVSRAWLE